MSPHVQPAPLATREAELLIREHAALSVEALALDYVAVRAEKAWSTGEVLSLLRIVAYEIREGSTP